MNRSLLLTAAVLLAIPSLSFGASSAPRYGTWGVSLADMDRAVKPGDDFFRFVNGSWYDRTVIAPDRTIAGVDVVLSDEAEREVREMAEAEATHPTGATGRKIGALYTAYMDQAAIERAGTNPLRPYLARIRAANTAPALLTLMMQPAFASPVVVRPSPDTADATRYAVFVTQGRLGMPSRDYYLLAGAKYDTIRAAYRAYVEQILTLAGLPEASIQADRIVALETAIAKEQWSPEQRRDVDKTNNPMTVAQLAQLAPQLDWSAAIAASGLGTPAKVIVREPSAVSAAARIMATTPISLWQDYLAFRFVSDHAQFLPRAFDDANFAFYGKTLRDQPQQRDRWKRAVALLNNSLGEAVGQLYVAKYYPPESDRQMGELIGNLRAAYGDELRHLGWMDDATRTQALAKLAAFDPRIGHPVKYIDYSSLQITPGNVLADAVRTEEFDRQLELSRFPKPVDRTLWNMTPQEVNAYYSPATNQVTFPAAILQPPYFDPRADAAVNYGGIGAVIGHEMGHGFDDQGRKYGPEGKVRDWWTNASGERFQARAAMLGKQFDAYEPVPGVHIKGGLTMGENIGDLGGLEMAWGAWRRYVAQHGEPAVVDGFTGDQRFLIAYAYSWQAKEREGALRQQLLSDPHSPATFRVNGIVRNFDPWYTAFNVKPGDKLYLAPSQRVHIWVD